MRFRRRLGLAWRRLRTEGERNSVKPNQRLPGSMKPDRPLLIQRPMLCVFFYIRKSKPKKLESLRPRCFLPCCIAGCQDCADVNRYGVFYAAGVASCQRDH